MITTFPEWSRDPKYRYASAATVAVLMRRADAYRLTGRVGDTVRVPLPPMVTPPSATGLARRVGRRATGLAAGVWRAAAQTSRRRRVTALALALMVSPAWAAASAPPVRGHRPAPVVIPAAVVAAIRAGRPAGYPVGGIDLSSHDHRRFAVQWPTEAAAGSEFVYIKATEGTTYVNPYFATDYAAARAAHRYVGAYVYARPDHGNPIGQADFFLRHARFARDAKTLVPFVDLEWPYSGVRSGGCYDLTPTQMRAWIHAFVGRIEAGIGRRPMIYTNTYWWDPCTGDDASLGGYPLDIANYTKKSPRLPAGWTTFALWQYTPGNSDKRDDHDRDVVNGGTAGLRALAWPPSTDG